MYVRNSGHQSNSLEGDDIQLCRIQLGQMICYFVDQKKKKKIRAIFFLKSFTQKPKRLWTNQTSLRQCKGKSHSQNFSWAGMS